MSVTSKWTFILIGNNATGKTTLQRRLVELLSGRVYDRLPSNTAYNLTDFAFLRKCRRFFVAGRSYQELRGRPNQYPPLRPPARAAHLRNWDMRRNWPSRALQTAGGGRNRLLRTGMSGASIRGSGGFARREGGLGRFAVVGSGSGGKA